jgi:aryl-alcohol dehydrogenase-like predicted oxidoreductase
MSEAKKMRTRRFGRLGWVIGEIGYGTWGVGGGEGGWSGAADVESMGSLAQAVTLGCNFFDTAWIYGRGHSEALLGQLAGEQRETKIHVATKVPPKDRRWPSDRSSLLSDVFPPEHIEEYVEKSRANLQTDRIDLLQFHVWEDAWALDPSWQRVIERLKSRGIIEGVGISVNRWEPWNVVNTLRTGLIDAVQVIYNIFDQSAEDELFGVCRELDIAVIARVPFDEGTLTGSLTKTTSWPAGDWRNSYFVPENLHESVDRAEALKLILPAGCSLPELALRFILESPDVHCVIPGMRRAAHVRSNVAVSDGRPMPRSLLTELRRHRWDRTPTQWSQ